MSRKSPNLSMSLPRCGHCGRYWHPAEGVTAKSAYCKRCAKERRAEAATVLGLRPLTAAETVGPYLPPRLLRST